MRLRNSVSKFVIHTLYVVMIGNLLGPGSNFASQKNGSLVVMSCDHTLLQLRNLDAVDALCEE